MANWSMEICSWALLPGKNLTLMMDIRRTHPVDRVLVMTVAAELAVRRDDVKGPGTFLPALIDELWRMTPHDMQSIARVRVD
jgi:hydroxyethylthiazole kinase-like sugar kinase family protein